MPLLKSLAFKEISLITEFKVDLYLNGLVTGWTARPLSVYIRLQRSIRQIHFLIICIQVVK